jgi:hypothetical protein
MKLGARDPSQPLRTIPGWLLPVAAGLLTVALFAAAALATGFVACGVSGCGGGGFGPAYAPVRAQLGLLVTGLTLLPLALWALRRRGRLARTLAAVAAVVFGTTLSMLLLGLGPNGCPLGQTRATTGPEGFDPGSSTCSADPDAVPRR